MNVKLTISMIKRAQQMRAAGYSIGLIAHCLDVPEWAVRFMVRRE